MGMQGWARSLALSWRVLLPHATPGDVTAPGLPLLCNDELDNAMLDQWLLCYDELSCWKNDSSE